MTVKKKLVDRIATSISYLGQLDSRVAQRVNDHMNTLAHALLVGGHHCRQVRCTF